MRLQRGRHKLGVPIAAVLLLLSACGNAGGSEEPPAEGERTGGEQGEVDGRDAGATTLRVNWGAFPDSWAPGTPGALPGYLRVPYETLVLRDLDGTISPNLATEWEFADDATSLTLRLRDDVLFHDGTEFNAEAVKATTDFVANDMGGQFGGPVKAGVDEVTVDEEHVVTFHFTRPYATFLDLLSQRNLMIASPSAIEDGSIVTHPVGTGPWRYDSAASIADTKMTFAAFDDYWGEKPGFANIELYGIADNLSAIAALESGELDVTHTTGDMLPRIDASAAAEYFEYPAIRNNVAFFDVAPDGIFGDERVRQALCMAMDNTVVEDMEDGRAEDQHFLAGEPGHNDEIVPFQGNLTAAQEMWAELGNPSVSIEWAAAPFNKQEITVRAEQMNQLENVNITVQELAVPQFLSTWNSGQYALGIGNHSEINPADWYGAWFSEASPANPAKYESEELKALAAEARAAGLGSDAEDKWKAVVKQIAEEARTCSHFVAFEVIAFNSDQVENVVEARHVWEPKLIDYRAVTPKD